MSVGPVKHGALAVPPEGILLPAFPVLPPAFHTPLIGCIPHGHGVAHVAAEDLVLREQVLQVLHCKGAQHGEVQ
eukprot:CAMPEP_0173326906 /NCGR_PEP_ID=MMETSP1144-20121109/1317_1 /TAXON_ID=483371 /ORGANISM="non described non described, Strain CCMP2298" /LENGTH=73 /DNA_ID=CAMNT_0014271251 /DNA_START=324 /DNA_END=545 /DNA_ORIENTATION=-